MARAIARGAKPKKVTTKPRSRTTAAKLERLETLRVRMYRVGFGDFFLISVPSPKETLHILVDCGVTRGKSQKGDIATIKSAVRHMARATNRKLALVIVTHRHQDHIVGFSRCADEFSRFEVGAVWMPYWEKEYGDTQRFQSELEDVAFNLRAAALAAGDDDATDEILGIVENATGASLTEGPGGGTNAKSLDLLKNGLGVTPEYYAAGDRAKLPALLRAAGLSAEILGPPPSDAAEFLALMDLKKTTGQYLDQARAKRRRSAEATSATLPFAPQFISAASEYPTSAFREWAPREPGVLPDFSRRYATELEAAVKRATPGSLLLAAKKLDSFLNNQSLVVFFQWKGKKLLFAGDAQGGNWEYWLVDVDAPIKDPSGAKLTAKGKSILSSIDFYKVGHHGSTNATPIAAVTAMGKDFVAMCSVEPGAFGRKENASEVPREPLLTALEKKSTVVRSDAIPVRIPAEQTEDGKEIDAIDVPAAAKPLRGKPKRGRLAVGSCYVDYFFE